jgi:hypothetical protein
MPAIEGDDEELPPVVRRGETKRRVITVGLAAALVAVCALDTFVRREAVARTATPEAFEIRSTPIAAFDKADPSRQRFGRLEFRGGLLLTSGHEDFGGLSDLIVGDDGNRLLAISDEGSWISADITYEGTRPTGLTNARMGKLLALGGRALRSKRDFDAEAMTLLEGTLQRGTILIAFERNHRIGRFPVVGGAVQAPTAYLKMPAEARRMSRNKSLEAVTVLPAGPLRGAVVAIAERLLDADGHHSGWIWIKDRPQPIALTNPDEFDVTSAASLPNGAVLVLERRFRWSEGVKMRLRYLRGADIKPGAVVDGEVLLQANMGYEIDNMEGLAVHKDARGDTVVTLVSDDNFNHMLQRTLLLQFTLHVDGLAQAPSR